MKRLTTIEKSIVAFGLVFIVVGAYMIIHPTEGVVFHPGPYKYRATLGPNPPEYVSKKGSRIYGGVSVVLGVGMSWLALCCGRK